MEHPRSTLSEASRTFPLSKIFKPPRFTAGQSNHALTLERAEDVCEDQVCQVCQAVVVRERDCRVSRYLLTTRLV